VRADDIPAAPPGARAASPPSTTARLAAIYTVEGLTCTGSTLMLVGIFFFTTNQFGWNLLQNLLLAAAQGAVYIFGALAAEPISRRIGRRRMLIGLHAIMATILASAWLGGSPWIIVPVLVVYSMVSGANWPALESLVCSGADARQMNRRVGIYNLVWSGGSALIFALTGTILHWRPEAIFLIAIAAHLLSAVIVLALLLQRSAAGHPLAAGPAAFHPPIDPHEDLDRLFRSRTLALWLSRICLPATFVVMYSLAAMMPSLPAISALPVGLATFISSFWMIARWLTFLLLGLTLFWHARPRLLLAAAVLMLLSYLAVVVPASHTFVWEDGQMGALAWIVMGQMLLGLALGMIYSGSLYFGMVLSEGSTEHGGYHEALIGLGAALGPGVAALAQWYDPLNPRLGLSAVAAILFASAAAAGAMTWRFRMKRLR
jgi:MFS family permease